MTDNLYLIFPQHVGLCPWFSPTRIIDAPIKDEIKVNDFLGLGLVPVDRVGEAFELAVTEQR